LTRLYRNTPDMGSLSTPVVSWPEDVVSNSLILNSSATGLLLSVAMRPVYAYALQVRKNATRGFRGVFK
jgi:hypothetical protein